MRIEKVILLVGGTSILLGAIAFAVSLLTEAPLVKTLAIILVGLGVIAAFLPLVGLMAYTVWEKLRPRNDK